MRIKRRRLNPDEYCEAWTMQDLIGLLPQRLLEPADFIRCAAVCNVWKSCFQKYSTQPTPWLMSIGRKDTDVRDFNNVLNGKSLRLSLPEAQGRFFMPTNHGWIFTLASDLTINLLHPLSRIQIPLPAADKFNETDMANGGEFMLAAFIGKVCLSSDPREKDCVVMVSYSLGKYLAFARLGDSSWTDIELPFTHYTDVMYSQGKFYAIQRNGCLVVCDISLSKPKATALAAEFPSRASDGYQWGAYPVYLCEADGNILAIGRPLTSMRRKPILPELRDKKRRGKVAYFYSLSFDVYKLNRNEQSGEMN